MKRIVVTHEGFSADIEAAVAWYRDVSPRTALDFLSVLEDRLKLVEMFPEAGSTAFASYRKLGLRQFPYLLIYQPTPRAVYLLGLLPSRRGPDWIRQQAESRG